MHEFLRLPAVMLLAGATQWAGAQQTPAATTPAPGAASQVESTPAQTPAQTPAGADSQEGPPPPKGVVLFQSHGAPPEPPDPGSESPLVPATAAKGYSSSGSTSQGSAGEAVAPVALPEDEKPSGPELTDAERAAITVAAYDLDARMAPAKSGLAMRAGLTLRNDGDQPLTRVALQISSTLKWDSVALVTPAGPQKLALAQHLIQTDMDHTGQANELVLALPTPLTPGAAVRLDAFYSGAVGQTGARLARIGADVAQAAEADWDSAGPREIALRGYGNVLWYPVSSPQYFLGQGNELFEAAGRMRLREASASVRLRLALEFQGEAPVAAYFCGRRAELHAISDNADAPVAMNSGIATAEFAAEPMGYRALSLFVLPNREELTAGLPSGNPTPAEPKVVTATPAYSSSEKAAEEQKSPEASALLGSSAAAKAMPAGPQLLAVASANAGRTVQLGDAAAAVTPSLVEWFGRHPASAVTVLDHAGQAFEDGPLVVAPAAALSGADEAPALTYSLAHAWAQTGQPWMDEGLSGLATLLVTEDKQGRDAAIAQLNDLLRPLLIAEPEFDSVAAMQAEGASKGQPLIAATSEVYYRRKATAVFWMLRSIVGDDALKAAVRTLVAEPVSHASAEEQAAAFQKLLEKTSGKDLGWLFQDWVLHDRGLPDLSFVDVTPRQLPAGQGHDSGWLVAVTVKNDGGATADVPVVIRSGTFSHTERMRVAPFSQAVTRVLVESAPDQVVLNDGSVPEVRTAQHVRTLAAAAK